MFKGFYVSIPFIIKFCFYLPWCRLGIKLADGTGYFSLRKHGLLELTLIRMLLGVFLGGAIWYLFAGYKGGPRVGHLDVLPSYLLLMLPTRWIEWGITECLLQGKICAKTLLLTSNSKFLCWRGGGIAIGLVLDAIMFYMLALLVGC